MREMEGPPDMGRTPILGTAAHTGDGACSRPQGQGQVGYNAGFQIVRGLSSSDPHVFLWGPNPSASPPKHGFGYPAPSYLGSYRPSFGQGAEDKVFTKARLRRLGSSGWVAREGVCRG